MKPDEIEKLQLQQLKEAAKIFLRPMERLPFPVVIEATTGKTVLPVAERPEDFDLLEKFSQACIRTAAQLRANRMAFDSRNAQPLDSRIFRR